MSLSASLSSAFSGLAAMSRMTEVVASNIANANTPGFVRREGQLSSRGLDGAVSGVRVTDVRRDVDRALLADRRSSDAGAGAAGRLVDFRLSLQTAIGEITAQGSLTDRISRLEAALLTASGQPDSDAFLGSAVTAARQVAARIGDAARTVQQEREGADARIAEGIRALNSDLGRVADLNLRIRDLVTNGRDASALLDERQQVIDTIAERVPLREVERPGGEVALFAVGGAPLLDGRPSVLGFQATRQIDPDMSVGAGDLSGLTLNGAPVRMSGADGLLSGGTLSADFDIRDRLAPEAQARLDGLARDLVERFSGPAVDSTLAVGQAGLFTDAGTSFDPARATGLAQRLSVNAALDPAQGGALWRLRDGIGAAAPGPAGNSVTLSALADALSASRPTGSQAFATASRSFAVLGADYVSMVSTDRVEAETEAAARSARQGTLRDLEMQGGVDTDREMQDLLAIEKAYGANAKVVQTVDELIRLLLGLGA